MNNSFEQNINLNIQNANGSTGFHLACENNSFETAKLMMSISPYSIEYLLTGIDLNARDNYGLTGFYYACINGCAWIVEMMLSKSKDLKLDLFIDLR